MQASLWRLGLGALATVGRWGCALRLGIPNRLSDAPAPTAIPLPGAIVPPQVPNPAPPLEPIQLPPGFQISVFAQGLDGPRMMAVGPDGQVYVAERGADRIRRGRGPDTQGRYLDFEVVVDQPPGGMRHRTRSVAFSPDGDELYVAAGAPCDVCTPQDERYAAIWRDHLDGSGGQLVAKGLRNPVGITVEPGSGELWDTNNGRDFLGDDLPPDTLHRILAGEDYGFPRCHAARLVDPDEGAPGACDGVARPAVELQAHSAPLGLAFYTGTAFPAAYQGDLFVAFHGSWNRRGRTGATGGARWT